MSVTPPRPKGPHLNAMRCFEAAARLGGFAAAAEELSVTPGAISQQVKALEEWVDAPLFDRRSQGVRLTGVGAKVQRDFTNAFDALGGALHRLRHEAAQGAVSIAALPSVAQLWVSPRLPAIRAAFPDCRISVTALERAPNLRREMFDLSVFFAEASEAKDGHVLTRDVIFPVCAPSVAAGLSTPADLADAALIHDATWAQDWQIWSEAAGVSLPGDTGPVFSLYAIAVEEACNGAGVLMGHDSLIKGHLASGALVAPFATRAQTGKVLVLEVAKPRGSDVLGQIITHLMR